MSTIVVSGASRGIGNAIASALQAGGYRVIGISRSVPADAKFEHLACDVRDPEQVAATFSAFRKEKNLYGLINCAGYLHTKPLISLPAAEIDAILDTNVKGTILCSKAIIRPLLMCGGGRIINFASIAADLALQGDSVYSASKAAVRVFSRALARELADRSITVNCISPGIIRTDMTKHLSEEQIEKMTSMQIINREGAFSDILAAIRYLLSDDAKFITGASLNLGGV